MGDNFRVFSFIVQAYALLIKKFVKYHSTVNLGHQLYTLLFFNHLLKLLKRSVSLPVLRMVLIE